MSFDHRIIGTLSDARRGYHYRCRIDYTSLLPIDRCDTPSVSAETRLAATLEVLDRKTRSGDELRYRINNVGSSELICGRGSQLERDGSGSWVLMNPGRAFVAVGFRVAAGESHELTAAIPADAPRVCIASARPSRPFTSMEISNCRHPCT